MALTLPRTSILEVRRRWCDDTLREAFWIYVTRDSGTPFPALDFTTVDAAKFELVDAAGTISTLDGSVVTGIAELAATYTSCWVTHALTTADAAVLAAGVTYDLTTFLSADGGSTWVASTAGKLKVVP